MKQFYSIILTIVYTLLIRLIDGYIVEINSLVFMILTPLIIGAIPFLIPNNDAYFKSKRKVIFIL